MKFTVIDNQTGQYPDLYHIALNEEWAKHMMYCDMDCFAITEHGDLFVTDDCGGVGYPPEGRFTIVEREE